MRLIITENQLNTIVSILSERYVEDSYMLDNDIYDYEPTQSEIDSFNKVDKPIYSDFRGFDTKNDPNKYDPNKNFSREVKFKREKLPSGKNYTGRAKIVYTYPGGMQMDVKNGIGPVAVIVDKLKIIKQQRTKDAPFFSIRYEIIDDKKKKIFEEIHPSEATDDLSSLLTVVEGKRNLCTVNFINSSSALKLNTNIKHLISKHNLKTLRIPSNPYNLYIVYRDGYDNNALELRDIAEKYDGFLSYKASPEDTFRIGQLLEYYESEIKGNSKNI